MKSMKCWWIWYLYLVNILQLGCQNNLVNSICWIHCKKVSSFQASFGSCYRVGQKLFAEVKCTFFVLFNLLFDCQQVSDLLFWPFLLMGKWLFISTFQFETEILIYSQKVPKTWLETWHLFIVFVQYYSIRHK